MTTPSPNLGAGLNEQQSVGDQAYEAAGSPELTPGPELLRMGSGDSLNPVQFASSIREVEDPATPAVHQNPTAYFGRQPGVSDEGEADDADND